MAGTRDGSEPVCRPRQPETGPLRLRYKVLLINSVAALVAAVVLSVAYANTRSVAQGYLMTLEGMLPRARALDGLQSAIIAVIGSTHELALLRGGCHNSLARRPATRKRQAAWSRDWTMKPWRS